MEAKLDSYTWWARVVPVYLTLLPAAASLFALLPPSFNFSFGSIATFLLIPVAYLAGQLGSDRGKALEQDLWEEWGGAPTTRFLRHSNAEFNSVTRGRVHENLRSLGLHVPSADEEASRGRRADEYYESCTEELISRTRDKSQHPLVFKGLIEYGFRRNLLGLRPVAICFALLSFIICIFSVVFYWQPDSLPIFPVAATVFTLLLLLVWIFWVGKSTVHVSAKRYARFLLEASSNRR